MTRSLTEINADIKAHTRAAAGINRWLMLIVPLWLGLFGWAVFQAEQHYQQQDKVNQEVAWKR